MSNLVLKYLASPRGRLAAAAAGVATVAHFVGLYDSGWPLVAGAAYVGVWLLPVGKPKTETPPPPAAERTTAQAIEHLRSSVMPNLPLASRELLGDILKRASELMPKLKEMQGAGLVQLENRTELKQTVKTHLPLALEAYLKLPSNYARTAKLQDGRTAEDHLMDQLTMLRDHVKGLQEAAITDDVNKLLAQSRYLNENFRKPLGLDLH